LVILFWESAKFGDFFGVKGKFNGVFS
jgi:hypothetical protein